MGDEQPLLSSTIDLPVGFQAWQARCLNQGCGWAYLIVRSDQAGVTERPPFHHCAVCGQAAVYFRLDPRAQP
jgi:hypothetical protein